MTDIAENPSPDKSFAVNLDLRWQMFIENATINRELYDTAHNTSYVADELAYKRTTNVIDFFAHFGVFKGFELHVDVPYIVQDVQNWQYATVNGQSVKNGSSIQEQLP